MLGCVWSFSPPWDSSCPLPPSWGSALNPAPEMMQSHSSVWPECFSLPGRALAWLSQSVALGMCSTVFHRARHVPALRLFVERMHWLIGPQQSTWINVPFSMKRILRDLGCLGSLVTCLSYHFIAGVKHICDENGHAKGHFSTVSWAIMLTVIWALFSSKQLRNEVISSDNSGMKSFPVYLSKILGITQTVWYELFQLGTTRQY